MDKGRPTACVALAFAALALWASLTGASFSTVLLILILGELVCIERRLTRG